MILTIYILSVLLFVVAFYFSKLALSFKEVMSLINAALDVIRDVQLTDLEKERHVQQSAIELMKFVLVIALKSAAVVFFAILPMLFAHALLGIPFGESSEFALRMDVLLITTVAMLGVWAAFRTLRKPPIN